MSLNKTVKRARASTRVLLGDDYEEDMTATPSLPEPPRDLSRYTTQRLKEGLRFADCRLRNKERKVTPLTEHCLGLYKLALKNLLEEEYADEEQRIAQLRMVNLYERDIYTRAFLRHSSDKQEQEFVEKLQQLRSYEFSARYGDYSAEICQRLKRETSLKKLEYYEQLQGWNRYWTDINADINREESKWRRYQVRDETVKPQDVKTTLAVKNGCDAIPFNFESTLKTIAMYADRNSLVHQSIPRIVENGDWPKLRELLSKDLREIPLIVPRHLQTNIPVIQETIQAVIDTYFVRDAEYPDDESYWIPKKAVVNQQRNDANSRKKAKENEDKKVHELATRRLEQLTAEHTMSSFIDAIPDLREQSGAGKSQKRSLASADSERMEKRQKLNEKQKIQEGCWKSLVGLAKNLYHDLVRYNDEYGNFLPPPNPRVWLDLAPKEGSQQGPEHKKEAGKKQD